MGILGDRMPLTVGSKFALHEVLAPIGAGAMGEVCDRDVWLGESR